MKSRELHRLIRRNGWVQIRASGSHIIYQKNNERYPVPYHGAKEIGVGLMKKIIKEMRLR